MEVPTEDAAVDWRKKLASEDQKNPVLKDNNSTREGVDIGVNLEGKEQCSGHTLRSFPVTPMLPESGDLGTRDAGAVAVFNYHQGGMK